MDANEVLTLTCQRLKDEAGRPQDFSYGDLAAVRQAQAGEVRMEWGGPQKKGLDGRMLASRQPACTFPRSFGARPGERGLGGTAVVGGVVLITAVCGVRVFCGVVKPNNLIVMLCHIKLW